MPSNNKLANVAMAGEKNEQQPNEIERLLLLLLHDGAYKEASDW